MPCFLMCPPDYYGVDYAINPWMADHIGDVDRELAKAQWQAVVDALTGAGAEIEFLTPEPEMPDLVFTSNAGLPQSPFFYPSRFRYAERRPEEAIYGKWFSSHRWCIEPTVAPHEGRGDLMSWRCGSYGCMFAGTGFRSSEAAHLELSVALEIEVATLRLVDPRYPHLDTCFRPLPEGRLLWVPDAFDRPSREAIEAHIPPPLRHGLDSCESLGFAANGIVVDRWYFTSEVSGATRTWLESAGLEAVILDVSEFLKSGGGVAALVLEL
ncbi:nitrate reductase [bacterium]|nr:MAG: nitrate reductase [bacterium]